MSRFNYFTGDLTLFEAQTGGAFDHLNWQHSGEFDQNFSKKSKPQDLPGGGGVGWGMGGFGIGRHINLLQEHTNIKIKHFMTHTVLKVLTSVHRA